MSFWAEDGLLDLLSLGTEVALLVVPGFLPLFVVTWQLHRVITGRDSDAWRTVAWLLAIVATAASVLGNADMAYFFAPIVANIGLLLYGRWCRLSQFALADNFLLGTYAATTLPWVLMVIAEGMVRIGAWLIVWTCLVYLATIAVRLWAADRSRSSTL